jgi:hypothetical protein
MQVHLAGQLAINVDQQKQSGQHRQRGAGRLVRLHPHPAVDHFPVPAGPVRHRDPALLSVAIAGPIIAELGTTGSRCPQLAQLLLIVLSSGRAPTTACSWSSGCGRTAATRRHNHDAVVNALTKVGRVDHVLRPHGHRGAAVAARRDLPDLLHPASGIPLAIGIGT